MQQKKKTFQWTALKGVIWRAKKNIILCIWCNAVCLCSLKVQKTHYFPHTVHSALSFWNALIFTKLIILKSPVCSDWPAIQCIVIGRLPQMCDGNVITPYHIWKHTASPRHGGGGGNNTTARIIVTSSFFAFTFGRCYANLPTQWQICGGLVWMRCFRKAWMRLNF